MRSVRIMMNVHAAHPSHEIDWARGADSDHFGLRSGSFELRLLLRLMFGNAAAGQFVENGAVGLVIAMASLHQDREPVNHLFDLAP